LGHPFQRDPRGHLPVMVKFQLPQMRLSRGAMTSYRYGNHVRRRKDEGRRCRAAIFKILIKFDLLAFEENSHRIRVDFAQKRRFIANDSFKPVC
jgi:hypothetical protein